MAARDIHRYTDLGQRPPYSSLAQLYDRVMAHVEYGEWKSLIEAVIKRFCFNSNPCLLELGGGTGTLGQKLKSSGFSYIGCDLAFPMCIQARKKALTYFCCDATEVCLKKKFDIAFFLYDGINYLISESDYSRLLKRVYELLKIEGLFLFDITTETNSLKHFYNYLDFEDFGEYSYVRHSYYKPSIKKQFNDFTIFALDKSHPNSSLYKKHYERHVQKIFSVNELKSLIPSDLFDIVGIWDGFTFKNSSSRSKRIHFLLRKH